MKLLHTSDWHLGRSLFRRKRYEEFESFLDWLVKIIQQREIDVLLVAGDVFDTSTPSNRAQELYYRFLCQIAASSCRHVVVIAGNHDSPSFLEAPRELLKVLDIHVVGGASDSPEDEVIVLRDNQRIPELIVCAVPYLRDRDVRVAEAGESVEDKGQKLRFGIRKHYSNVAAAAEKKRAELGTQVPIVAMGHLFTAGGKTVDGDGVRELYIGSLAHVGPEIFSPSFDYVALGHLHVPQTVNGCEHIRYSGSPLPMGFGEANQKKGICVVEFNSSVPSVQTIDIPVFQRLARVTGNLNTIISQIGRLREEDFNGWIEVIYDGTEVIGNLRERVEEEVANTEIDILRVKNNQIIGSIGGSRDDLDPTDILDENEMFERCLSSHEVPERQKDDLRSVYQIILLSMHEEDLHAE